MKNSQLNDISHFKFSIIYRTEIYSCRSGDFCDLGTAWKRTPSFNSIQDFLRRLPQTLQRCSTHPYKFHHLEDEIMDTFNYVFSTLSSKRRSLNKISIYTDNQCYDSR